MGQLPAEPHYRVVELRRFTLQSNLRSRLHFRSAARATLLDNPSKMVSISEHPTNRLIQLAVKLYDFSANTLYLSLYFLLIVYFFFQADLSREDIEREFNTVYVRHNPDTFQ